MPTGLMISTNSFRYRPPTVPPLLMVLAVIYCYNHGPPSHLVLDACYTHIYALSLFAAVKVGKADRRPDQTQIGDMVKNGRPNQNHQWVSHREQ